MEKVIVFEEKVYTIDHLEFGGYGRTTKIEKFKCINLRDIRYNELCPEGRHTSFYSKDEYSIHKTKCGKRLRKLDFNVVEDENGNFYQVFGE